MSNKLPKKEAELFKQVIDYYDTKKYDKGIKVADIILKKFPTNSETLAMKGLLLNCLGKKEEAYELVKAGLKNDVRSQTAWHVYGLIYRSDGNYKEASKCYLNSIRIDENGGNTIAILRDLSCLQIQLREMEAFLESRRKILYAKNNLPASWIAFAVANYFNGLYDFAFDTVSKYQTLCNDRGDRYQESELILFQNRCLEKQGKYDEGLNHLQDNISDIVDKLAVNVKKAEYLVILGRFDEAKLLWNKLIGSQTENYKFHCGLQAAYLELTPEMANKAFQLKNMELPCTCFNLGPEQLNLLKELYSQEKFSRSMGSKKIKLHVLRGDEFRSAVDEYLRHCLHEGIPAVHHDICSLIYQPSLWDSNRLEYVKDPFDFRSHQITSTIMELLDGYIAALKTNGTFKQTPTEDTVEPPSSLLWTLFLKCHMLEMSGNLELALSVIEESIEHTPTALDMYLKKARILKKSGDIKLAAKEADDCRALDLQDRYLNNKATKYLMRSNQIQQGMDTIAMFTKHDGDPEQMLFDLQCNWYELEVAEAYAREKKWGLALKKFYAVQKHFMDYVEDMFDFHAFCLKKVTLRVYDDIIKMLDAAYSHKFFQRAAIGVLKIFLHLLDKPEDTDGLGHLDAVKRKKERAKIKKQKEKEEKAKEEAEKEAKLLGEHKKKEDVDPVGEKLLQKNFLTEASTWCSQLKQKLDLNNEDVLTLLSEVYLRKGKPIIVMKALLSGFKKCPHHPDLTVILVKVAMRVKGGYQGVSTLSMKPVVSQLVLAELKYLIPDLDIANFIQNYSNKAIEMQSVKHRLGAAKCIILADKSAIQSASSLLLCDEIWNGRGVTLKNIIACKDFLAKELNMESEAEAFRIRAAAVFPLATAFQINEGINEENEGDDDIEG